MIRPPDKAWLKVLLLVLAAAACLGLAPTTCSSAKDVGPYELGRPGKVEVSTRSDSIVIKKSSSVSSVQLEAGRSGVPFDPGRDIERKGSTLVVRPRTARRWWDVRTWRPRSGRITLLVPSDLRLEDLRASAASGSVSIVCEEASSSLEVSRSASLSTLSGSIKVDGISAPAVDLGSASGSIDADFLYSDEARLHTASGSIEVGRFEGGELRLDSASGSVALYDTGSFSDMDVRSASGSVYLETGEGLAPGIKIRSVSGQVVIDGAPASSRRREVVIEGGPGTIEVETASGSARVETHR